MEDSEVGFYVLILTLDRKAAEDRLELKNDTTVGVSQRTPISNSTSHFTIIDIDKLEIGNSCLRRRCFMVASHCHF